MSEYSYKIANNENEFNQIHILNHKTFSKEIKQHPETENNKLIDKFHDENVYIIAICKKKVVGMLAVRAVRPFSLDSKLKNLDSLLPAKYQKLCEVRLLAIEKEYRRSKVILGLMNTVIKHCSKQKYDGAVISGITHQIKLYTHLGFKKFGPLVKTNNVLFQPMHISTRTISEKIRKNTVNLKKIKTSTNTSIKKVINLLPGPVEPDEKTTKAMRSPVLSHRSEEFKNLYNEVRESLSILAGTKHTSLFLGSGTLANDAIAAQLAQNMGNGLVLVNGEFGTRLVKHCQQFNLDFQIARFQENMPVKLKKIETLISKNQKFKWLWLVHCETSTGVINPVREIQQIAKKYKVEVCIDAISSLGCVEVDFSNAYLASGVSGKALGAYAGIACVFHNHIIKKAKNKIPQYLDLYQYKNMEPPFTSSSNLLAALKSALSNDLTNSQLNQNKGGNTLNEHNKQKSKRQRGKHNTLNIKTGLHSTINGHLRFENLMKKREKALRQVKFLRKICKNNGIRLSSSENHSNPRMLSLDLPNTINSITLGEKLRKAGFNTGFESTHLKRKNRLQICFFGDVPNKTGDEIAKILQFLDVVHTDQLF